MNIGAKISKCIVWVALIGLGIFTIVTYMNDVESAKRYRENGGETIAAVTDAYNYTRTERSGSRKHRRTTTKDYSDFTIEYTVDGKDYTKRCTGMSGTYSEGETLTVYYLNDDPEGSTRFYLEPSASANIIVSSALIIIGGVGLAVTIRKFKNDEY